MANIKLSLQSKLIQFIIMHGVIGKVPEESLDDFKQLIFKDTMGRITDRVTMWSYKDSYKELLTQMWIDNDSIQMTKGFHEFYSGIKQGMTMDEFMDHWNSCSDELEEREMALIKKAGTDGAKGEAEDMKFLTSPSVRGFIIVTNKLGKFDKDDTLFFKRTFMEEGEGTNRKFIGKIVSWEYTEENLETLINQKDTKNEKVKLVSSNWREFYRGIYEGMTEAEFDSYYDNFVDGEVYQNYTNNLIATGKPNEETKIVKREPVSREVKVDKLELEQLEPEVEHYKYEQKAGKLVETTVEEKHNDVTDKKVETVEEIKDPEEIVETEHEEIAETLNPDQLNNRKILNTELGNMARRVNKRVTHVITEEYPELPTNIILETETIKELEDSFGKVIYEAVRRNKESSESLDAESEKFDWCAVEDKSTIEFIGYDFQGEKIDFKYLDNKLINKKAVLLQGVPGTGKTRLLDGYSKYNRELGNVVEVVSFHPTYSYSDFIGGTRANESGVFKWHDGLLLDICKRASNDRTRDYFIIIDELSRGDVQSIFGEAMKGITSRETIIKISHNKEILIPGNVYFIAAMNVKDKSAAKIDIATKQRFEIVTISPQWGNREYLEAIACGNSDVLLLLNRLAPKMVELNSLILSIENLGKDSVIGTRDITIPNPDVDRMKYAIRNSLIESINGSIKSGLGSKKAEYRLRLDNIIDSIDKLAL